MASTNRPSEKQTANKGGRLCHLLYICIHHPHSHHHHHRSTQFTSASTQFSNLLLTQVPPTTLTYLLTTYTHLPPTSTYHLLTTLTYLPNLPHFPFPTCCCSFPNPSPVTRGQRSESYIDTKKLSQTTAAAASVGLNAPDQRCVSVCDMCCFFVFVWFLNMVFH